MLKGLISAGWDETVFKYDLSSLIGSAYVDGRPPDIEFSKSRKLIESTNSIRLWLSPIRHRGKGVFVASVSRSIDPNIDEALVYLAEDLVMARTIRRWGYVGGVGEVNRNTPRHSFANSPYWTNGNRLVLEMAQDKVPPTEVESFNWDWKGRRSAPAAAVNAH